MFIEERFPSFFIFFRLAMEKLFWNWNRPCSNLATSFHMKSRKGSGWKKKMKQKKNKSIEREHNQITGGKFNSCYFRKYKSMKIQHQRFLWTKRQQFAYFKSLLSFCPQNLLMLYFHAFVFSGVTRIEPNPRNLVFFAFITSGLFLFHSFFSTGRFSAFHVKRCC